MISDFKTELSENASFVERLLAEYLPSDSGYKGSLIEAMRYSTLNGGKRIRPVLLLNTCKAFNGNCKEAEPFACALELIHNASLVHDDLPAIDNDFLRRGKPTTHAKYGEAVGVLSSDALLNYAYELIIKGISGCSDKENAIKAAEVISRKSGIFGMLGGQGLDVESDKGFICADNLEFLNEIYEKKTAALLEAALMAGAYLAGASDEEVKALERIGSYIGVSFQIIDDVLEVTSNEEVIGKPVNSDSKNGKETYASLLGAKKAGEIANDLNDKALCELKGLSCDKTFLEGMILYLRERDY